MEVRKFTDSAIRQAEKTRITKRFLKNRPVIEGYTIDGPTSKDLDDGLNMYKKGDNYILEISIADITSVIKLYSELFRIAYDRIETRYLSDYNIPMLPAILSENRLSLLPGDLRPAITFYMEISSDGDVVNLEIKETAFKNIRRLSYQAFDIIARTDKDDKDHQLFAEMINMAEYLIDRRRSKGALAIYDLKKGIYTNEEGMILPLKKGRSHYGNLVIQEFSILTNKSVAWFFAKEDIPILFRNHTIKHSAPNRKEILEQINTSIMHPQHLNALRRRSQLWFNRADYGPVVRGHFGLNEPVYTHVTSPIRRLADLINHYVIKSYIHNTDSPLKFEQLESMAKDINIKKNIIRDEKVEYEKEKIEKTSLQILTAFSEEEIEFLKDNEFTNVLRVALKNDIISDKLSSVLDNRFKTNKIDPTMLYVILFKSRKDSTVWLDFKKEALYYIKQTKGLATQLLHILIQKNIIKNYISDVEKKDDYYYAKTAAVFHKELLVTEKGSVSIKKKDAVNQSSLKFLQMLLDIHLAEQDPIQEIEEIDKTNVIKKPDVIEKSEIIEEQKKTDNNIINNKVVEKEKPIIDKNYNTISSNKTENINLQTLEKLKEHFERGLQFNINDVSNKISDSDNSNHGNDENYVGKLQELCVKNPVLSSPHYEFEVKGMSHSPIITCFANIVTPDLSIDKKAVANSKKKAKQEAARKLLNVLINKGLDKFDENLKTEINNDKKDNRNFVGKLLEFCIKAKLPPPDYSFKKMGKDHNLVFECSLSINILGEIKEFNAYAHSKKKSKHFVSEKCYNYLKEHFTIDEERV